ncbi:MAG: rhodanese-like domain-containing protein [Tannerella sp.]|jgi:rhodanese-related sulfurtransferase|nr:rhodanese-like domain-containing protein [Tannerella sp.]
MKLRTIITSALFFLLMTACNAQTKTENSQQTPEQIALNDSTVIVDVRTPEEYASGHIEKSINIPLDVIASKTDQLAGYKTIITVCRSGGRSARAKTILDNAGFKNVINGGGWEQLNSKINK